MDRKDMLKNIPENEVIGAAKDQLEGILGTLVVRGLGGIAGSGGTGMVVTLKVTAELDEEQGTVRVQSTGKVDVKVGRDEVTKPKLVDVIGQGSLFKGV